MDRNVVVIGLDGMDWPLIELLINEGRLENVQRIMEDGWSSSLETVMPPMTVPAWGSFSTGKYPGKHGCYDFVMPDDSLQNLRPVSGQDVLAERFYETLSERGKQIALINLPTTFPPNFKRTKNDVVITSLMTRGSDFVYPSSLSDDIPELKNYQLSPNKDDKSRSEYIQSIESIEETRFTCGQQIFQMDDWDFFFYLISGTDWIQHEVYGELMEDVKFEERDTVLDAYQRFDEHLGWFFDQSDEDTLFIFLSDHGFDNRQGFVNVNTLLNSEGLLAKERGESESEFNMRQLRNSNSDDSPGFSLERIGPWLLKHPRILSLGRKIYHRLQSLSSFEVDIRPFRPDFSQTSAYYPRAGAWGIYINSKKRFDDGTVTDDQYEETLQLIYDLLQSYETEAGEPVFYDIQTKDERYEGEFASRAPDLTFRSDIYHPHSHLEPRDTIKKEHNGHGYEGILCLAGDTVQNEVNYEEAVNIVDIAPTILSYLDVPMVSDMDGLPLDDIVDVYDSGTIDPTPTEDLISRYSDEATDDNQEVESRLRDLGYL